MWRWPEQRPVSPNRTLVERHISYRVPVSDGSLPSLPPPSTEWPPAWPSNPWFAQELARIGRSTLASRFVVAGDRCPGHARALRVREPRVMWRSRSRKGGILGLDRLEAA